MSFVFQATLGTVFYELSSKSRFDGFLKWFDVILMQIKFWCISERMHCFILYLSSGRSMAPPIALVVAMFTFFPNGCEFGFEDAGRTCSPSFPLWTRIAFVLKLSLEGFSLTYHYYPIQLRFKSVDQCFVTVCCASQLHFVQLTF